MNGSSEIARRRVRDRLTRILSAEGPIDVLEAALWVAAEEYPLRVPREIERVHILSAEGARRAYKLSNPFARLDALRAYFFEEMGFQGNTENYNDPDNCFLNRVLDTHLGIPLTLSVLFMQVARAAGFETRGIGLPGHFVVGVSYGGRQLMVDPFHGGGVITEEDCRQLVARTTGRASLFRRELLVGSAGRSMIGRLLLNLKHIYVEREDYGRALSVVDRLMLLAPDDSTEVRDRGFLQAHLGRSGAAIADLEAYLTLSPTAPDAESVRGRLSWLRRRLSEMN